MIQLSKNGSFLFVRAMDTKNPKGETVKSYLLEFDNGRNVLFVASEARVDDLRPFLYALRDEGKEVHLAFMSGHNASNTADLIGLFQPQEAVVTGLPDQGAQAEVTTRLKDQFFQGALIFAPSGETILF